MPHQKVDFLFLSPIDSLDPAKVHAAQLLQKNGIRVVVVGPGQPMPTEPQVVEIPRELLGNIRIYDAIQAVTEAQPWVVVRHVGERPAMSVEYARSRGFTEPEIEAELKPWIQKGKDIAAARVAEAQQKLETAVKEQAAVLTAPADYVPLPEPAAK